MGTSETLALAGDLDINMNSTLQLVRKEPHSLSSHS